MVFKIFHCFLSLYGFDQGEAHKAWWSSAPSSFSPGRKWGGDSIAGRFLWSILSTALSCSPSTRIFPLLLANKEPLSYISLSQRTSILTRGLHFPCKFHAAMMLSKYVADISNSFAFSWTSWPGIIRDLKRGGNLVDDCKYFFNLIPLRKHNFKLHSSKLPLSRWRFLNTHTNTPKRG